MAGVQIRRSRRKSNVRCQRQTQFDDAEVAGEVGGRNAEDAHQFVAHFHGQFRELASLRFWRSAGDAI